MKLSLVMATSATIAGLLLAGCGGNSPGTGAYGSTAATPTATAAPSKATLRTAQSSALGSILVDGGGRTVYLFQADKQDRSACDDQCAEAWPPVLTDGTPRAADSLPGTLGTTKRTDGETQVTYQGHPLYTFAGDSAPGQTNGEGSTGFGAPWYAVSPDGTAVTAH